MRKILSLTIIFLFFSAFAFCQTKQLDLGDKVPFFNLPNQDGKTFCMKDSIGTKKLVIFFYPKDENIICTKELSIFSDSIATFNKAGALVIGISQNSRENLKKFHDEHKLKYDLLYDSTGVVLKAFGLKENLFSDRVTYVANIAGVIVFKGYSLANGKKQAEEALRFLREMK